MSTATINVSNDGWISEFSKSSVLSGAKLYSSNYNYNAIGQKSNVTAYLQFSVPAAVLLKKITKAVLHYYVNDDISVNYGNLNTAYHPYLIGALEGITYQSVNEHTIGEAKVVSRRFTTAQWIAEDITDIFQNNIVNGIFSVLVSCGLPSSTQLYRTYIEGKSGSYASYLTVEYEDVEQLPPSISYPNGVYVREGEAVTFSWIYNSLTQATQASATIRWRVKGESWNTISVNSSAHYYKAEIAFPQGTIEWRVCVTNSIAETSNYSEVAEFTVQGKPAIPVIQNIENKCLPCIRWNAADQCAFEIELAYGDEKLIQETVYSGVSEYRPQMFLSGTYTVTIRTRNSIDLWSDKASKTFVINPPATAVPRLTVRQDGARVILEAEHEEGTKLAIIRNGEIIAVTEASEYEDNTAISGAEYEYKVRAYEDGYSDSETVFAMVRYDGFILQNDEKEVNCKVSEQRFLQMSMKNEIESYLVQYDGREYPVLETGTAKSQTITRTVTVTEDQYEDLVEISRGPAFYRDNEGNALDCAVSIGSCNRFMNRGYSITLEITRLEKEEVLLNE